MIRLENILKMSWRHLWETSLRPLEDLFARHFKIAFKMSWRCLANVFLQDVMKTSWRRITKTNICLDQDVFWKRMSKANIFVLINTSSEDEDERRLQDVFIKTNVCWFVGCIAKFKALFSEGPTFICAAFNRCL